MKQKKLSSLLGMALLITMVSLAGFLMNEYQTGIISAETEVEQADVRYEGNLTIENGDSKAGYPFVFGRNTTAFDALLQVAQTYGFKVDYQMSDFGAFIESIDGIAGNDEAMTYWMFYINGESAMVGVSLYILNNGDQISFQYETMSF